MPLLRRPPHLPIHIPVFETTGQIPLGDRDALEHRAEFSLLHLDKLAARDAGRRRGNAIEDSQQRGSSEWQDGISVEVFNDDEKFLCFLLLLDPQVGLQTSGALEVPGQRWEELGRGGSVGEGVEVSGLAAGREGGCRDDYGGLAVVAEVVGFAGEELARRARRVEPGFLGGEGRHVVVWWEEMLRR